jgi:glutaredoxin
MSTKRLPDSPRSAPTATSRDKIEHSQLAEKIKEKKSAVFFSLTNLAFPRITSPSLNINGEPT